MQNKSIVQLTILSLLVGFSACSPSADKQVPEAIVHTKMTVPAIDSSAAEYTVDTINSSIDWTGNKVVGESQTGSFKVKIGRLAIEYNNIIGGSFEIDINSLQPKGLDEASAKKLRSHLLSADFFNAAKHPKARFDIISIAPYSVSANHLHINTTGVENPSHSITGNLTMRDSVKTVSFPARIEIAHGEVKIASKFTINRLLWGIRYDSDRALGDKMIKEEVAIKLDVIAKRSGKLTE